MILAMLTVAGCGTSEYENRLNTQGIASAKLGETLAVYNQLFGRDKIYPGDVDSPTIRLPLDVQTQFAKGAADPEFSNKPIAPTEWTVPNMELPAQRVCWRGYKLTKQSANKPLYVYLCQQKIGKGTPLVDAVNALLPKAFPGKPVTWTDESFIAEDGVTQVAFKKAHITGDMPFGTPPMGEETMAGTLDLYVHSSNGWEVLVGLRISDDLDDVLKLTTIVAPAVCGSLQVPAPAAPAQ
jgi:hypothetical protein